MNHFAISQKLIQHCKSTTIKKETKFSSVAQLCPTLCDPHGLQHPRLPYPSPSPGACSNSCPLNRWCHSTISSSVVPFRTSTCFWLVSKEAESEMRILVSKLLREGLPGDTCRGGRGIEIGQGEEQFIQKVFQESLSHSLILPGALEYESHQKLLYSHVCQAMLLGQQDSVRWDAN